MMLSTPTDLPLAIRHRETSGIHEVVYRGASSSTWLAATSAFTSQMTLSDIPGERYTLRRTVYLSVESDPEIGVVLHEPITDAMGCGKTLDLAVQELAELLVDSYEQLLDYEGRLAPRLAQRLMVLRGVLKIRHGALAHGAAEARWLLGDLAEDRFYGLVKRGVIPSLKIGDRRLIFPRVFIAALARYVIYHPGALLDELDPAAVMAEAGA